MEHTNTMEDTHTQESTQTREDRHTHEMHINESILSKEILEDQKKTRIDHMTYLPGMEDIGSEILDQVVEKMNAYDYDQYTAADVKMALAHSQRTPEDFQALLSPAALPYLEKIAQAAQVETRKHFGNSVYMFTPIYIANYCENYCIYCGFNCHNKINRARLNAEEIEKEMQAIAATGLQEILILTGESRSKSDVEYIGEACKIARKYFKVIGLEIYPVNSDEYAYLHECGADYVTVFQETYNSDKYETLHLAGHKRIYPYRVNAQERYYAKLAGVTEPEQKRKIIGEEFIRVFEEEAKKIGAVDFLAQGTIYPDVVESGLGGESAVIKSHHNVGGLPDYVDFKDIIEPLRNLFKDEVRKAGLELGLPDYLVYRQPFPGPGLGIRIIGEVTAEKVRIVQDADYIYREEIAKAGLDRSIGQYFAALTNMRSVGVMGDERTYDYAVALRAVNTVDFMTAEAADIPFDVLQTVMSRIINEVKGVNRVFYDLTSKPPGTIEFE